MNEASAEYGRDAPPSPLLDKGHIRILRRYVEHRQVGPTTDPQGAEIQSHFLGAA